MEGKAKEAKLDTGHNLTAQDNQVLTPPPLDYVSLLPPEVWQIIIEQLTKLGSSEDLENLANSSEFFQKLLEPQRTNFLFEKVFPHVAASIWKKEGLEGLPVSDVLKFRGVSKQWSHAIHKLVPRKLQHFGKDSAKEDEQLIGKKFKSIQTSEYSNFVSRTDGRVALQNFFDHFKLSHPSNQSNGRNPWIWGNISVQICRDAEVANPAEDFLIDGELYMINVWRMILKYGSHINKLTLLISAECIAEVNESMLRKWLLEMPNLKKLQCDFPYTWELMDFSDLDSDEEMERALEYPKLQFLEKVSTCQMCIPTFNKLIKNNCHVNTVIIEARDGFGEGYDLFSFPMMNLKRFEMSGCPDDIVEKLGSSQVQWPLERLELSFSEGFGRIWELFDGIQNKFGSTLECFSLEMKGKMAGDREGRRIWRELKNGRLELPKLRKMSIDLGDEMPICLDFLLGMKDNLEEISAKRAAPKKRNLNWMSGAIVQFYGFEEKILESNVWGIFEKLKKIEVVRVTSSEDEPDDDSQEDSQWYSREDWMGKLE